MPTENFRISTNHPIGISKIALRWKVSPPRSTYPHLVVLSHLYLSLSPVYEPLSHTYNYTTIMIGAYDFFPNITVVIKAKNRFTLQKYSFFFPGAEMLKVHPLEVPFDLSTKFRRAKYGEYVLLNLCLIYERKGADFYLGKSGQLNLYNTYYQMVPPSFLTVPHFLTIPPHSSPFPLISRLMVVLDYVPRIRMEMDDELFEEEERERARNNAAEELPLL